jgi:DNA repair exonuclease SbcCD ATPase subunit
MKIITSKILRYSNHIEILEEHLNNDSIPNVLRSVELPPPLLTNDHDLIGIYRKIKLEVQKKLMTETIKHLKKRKIELENQGIKIQEKLKHQKEEIEQIKKETTESLKENLERAWSKVERIKQKKTLGYNNYEHQEKPNPQIRFYKTYFPRKPNHNHSKPHPVPYKNQAQQNNYYYRTQQRHPESHNTQAQPLLQCKPQLPALMSLKIDPPRNSSYRDALTRNTHTHPDIRKFNKD